MRGWLECPACYGSGSYVQVNGQRHHCQRIKITRQQAPGVTCVKCGGKTFRRVTRDAGICAPCEEQPR